MESKDQALQTYKNLVNKNKEALASLSTFVSKAKELFPRMPSQGFQQMKQQYDLALAASKASIDRNAQLQAQLQFKQDRLRSLREKFYRHFEEMEGLQFQMKRATGELKKEMRNRQESSRVMQSNQKLKRDVEKLSKRRSKLEQEEAELAVKERVKKQTIAKIEQEIQESERRCAEEEKAEALRIQKLEQQIARQQSVIHSLKIEERNATPPKRNKSIIFEQLRERIARQKESLQD